MFYLIGGAPRSGKTTIAKRLSERLAIPWISTDTLEAVVMGYVPESEFDKVFPKSVVRKATNHSNDEMYEKYSSEQIVDLYFKQGESLSKGIEAFIAAEASFDHDYIIEGYHILPELVSRLSEKFPVTALFVGRENVAKTKEAIATSSHKNDWVIAKTKKPETYTLIAQMLSVFSSKLKQQTSDGGLQYESIDGDFDELVDNLVGKLNKN